LGRKGCARLRALRDELLRAHPDINDLEEMIRSGEVLVHGRVMTNPSSRVRAGSSIAISHPRPLRGEAKLRAALAAFAVDPCGRIALDVGAAAGGFTRVLLGAGARRVYAVDVGHGQRDRLHVRCQPDELGLAGPPEDRGVLEGALRRAVRGFGETGWDVEATMESPVRGSHGAVEFLLHAVRRRG
jgi:predicted rRNA methylase YqxC with S4 and FtsJ domains